MAGRGPAPKLPEQRVGRAVPTRGEWVEIPVERVGPIPDLDGDFSAATRRAWESWWRDGAATLWTPADVSAVFALAQLFEAFQRGQTTVAAEVRLRSDALGLSQKGKRDLRWRVAGPDQESAEPRPAPPSRKSRLKVVV